MKNVFIITTVLHLLTSCVTSEKRQEIGTLPITKINFSNTNEEGNGVLSEYFDIVNVIQLETDSLSLISEITGVSIMDSSIFIFDKKYSSVKVFNLKGEYLYSIGKLGQAEGEFTSLNDFYLNKAEKTVYLYSNSSQGILKYSIQGKFINKIKTPFFAYYMVPLGNTNIVYYVNYNYSPKSNQNNLVFTDYSGNVNKLWAPYKNPETNAFSFTGYICQNADGVLFGKAFNDTLYQIYRDKKITPKYHLNFDIEKSKNWESLPKEKLRFETTREWTVLESGFLETDNLLSFTLDNKTRISKYFFLKQDKTLISERYFNKNSLIRFLSQPRSSINNVLISSVKSDYFLAIKKIRPELLDYIKKENTDVYNKLNTLNENDNPVIILYKTKK